MKIPLDRHSPIPIYRQIRDYFSRLIQTEKLSAGQKLPSIRALSESIAVNKLTVMEAYSTLEADGLIHARQGAGYFVNHIATENLSLRSHFSPTQTVTISAQAGNSFFEQFTTSTQAQQLTDVIDFSSGFPAMQALDSLQRIAKKALNHAAIDSLFRYDLSEGQPQLRQQIAQLLLQQGLEVSPEELIVTNGSQQALSLAMQYYLQPGDWVIVEAPTYHGAIGLLESLQARVIGIPMTATGMNLELLEQYLRSHRPKLIYTISTVHNPTGITTSHAHRQQLLALAEQYECPILEDNAYEALNFESIPAPIKASDRHDLVIYINTFTKTLMPGLRVGYMVVTGAHHRPILKLKTLHDMHVSTVSQAIVSEYLASGSYRRHLNRLRTSNLQSRNAMLQAMENYFPDAIAWTIPKGGLFLWTHLPDDLPIQEICREAIAQNILVASGSPFFPGKAYPAMRLNFSHSPEKIDRGIQILGQLLKQHLKQHLIPAWSLLG